MLLSIKALTRIFHRIYFFADIFWITPLKNKDIKEIILKLIDKFSADSSIPFDEPAIDKFVEYSLGLPGAATRLALLCLRNAYQIGMKKRDKPLVEHVAANEGYDTACSLPCFVSVLC